MGVLVLVLSSTGPAESHSAIPEISTNLLLDKTLPFTFSLRARLSLYLICQNDTVQKWSHDCFNTFLQTKTHSPDLFSRFYFQTKHDESVYSQTQGHSCRVGDRTTSIIMNYESYKVICTHLGLAQVNTLCHLHTYTLECHMVPQ